MESHTRDPHDLEDEDKQLFVPCKRDNNPSISEIMESHVLDARKVNTDRSEELRGTTFILVCPVTLILPDTLDGDPIFSEKQNFSCPHASDNSRRL